MCISGLVAEYIVAIDVTRVRLPADAVLRTGRLPSPGSGAAPAVAAFQCLCYVVMQTCECRTRAHGAGRAAGTTVACSGLGGRCLR